MRFSIKGTMIPSHHQAAVHELLEARSAVAEQLAHQPAAADDGNVATARGGSEMFGLAARGWVSRDTIRFLSNCNEQYVMHCA